MNMSELFNMDFNRNPQIITIAGQSCVGKTSVMTIIACEALKDSKTVLYITDENFRTIGRRFVNLLSLDEMSKYDLIVKSTKKYDSINEYLEYVFEEKGKRDIVYIDIPHYELDYDFIKKFGMDHNTTFLISNQMYRDLSKETFPLEVKSSRASAMSDMIIGLNKIEVKEDTFWEKFINFICFWKEKKVKPNLTLNIIKNRYGASGSRQINFNFKDLSFKVLSNKK